MNGHFEHSYTTLPPLFYEHVTLNKVQNPSRVIVNEQLARDLHINPSSLYTEEAIQLFAGNEAPLECEPLAQAYVGHQFGHLAMLGDGRAILIGEHVTEDGQRFDIQLKGAGRTPFSRGGDGRAALGPMLREYLISEAMHALRIPTTRSLAVVTTGEEVLRQQLLPGAVLTRVASSHLRVGTFQYAAIKGSVADVKALADYAIWRHYPSIQEEEQPYLQFLTQVIERQATLIAQWQSVGFIHGVMNTDNMTISGETIDYGPCAFLDVYNPQKVFSSIDTHGRYAYKNQPNIALWNLARFAESLLALLDEDAERAIEKAQQALQTFAHIYEREWLNNMRQKLGLVQEEKEDVQLIDELLQLMYVSEADYTHTFSALTEGNRQGCATGEWKEWLRKWDKRLAKEQWQQEELKLFMQKYNPLIIPRNYIVEEVLQAAVEGDIVPFEKFLQALQQPFAYTDEQRQYAKAGEIDDDYRTFCGT